MLPPPPPLPSLLMIAPLRDVASCGSKAKASARQSCIIWKNSRKVEVQPVRPAAAVSDAAAADAAAFAAADQPASRRCLLRNQHTGKLRSLLRVRWLQGRAASGSAQHPVLPSQPTPLLLPLLTIAPLHKVASCQSSEKVCIPRRLPGNTEHQGMRLPAMALARCAKHSCAGHPRRAAVGGDSRNEAS